MADQDPANPQPFLNFPSDAVRQRLDERLRSLPIQDAIRQSFSKELGTLLNAETLNATFRDLVTGRTSLDQSLQQLANTASQVLNTVMEAEQQRSDEENLINQKILEALQQDRSSRDRKNYVLRGQVLNELTQEPITGLMVQATNRQVRKDKFLGLDITDREGRFEIDFGTQDVQEGSEQLYKVILHVGVDLQTALYTTDKALVVHPKQPKSTTILLPAELAAELLQLVAEDRSNFVNRLQAVNTTIARTHYQHLQMQSIGNALKTELAQFLNTT
ncbi:MAG: hypothetical protein WCD18_14050 [Thermosynechococcaceae cyanobacterium]